MSPSHEDPRQPALPPAVDVAVVGAGAAGLYAAFRLTSAAAPNASTSPRSVAIFECAARTGGRLCTARLSPASADTDPVVDMGAMRLLRSQRLLSALVDRVLTPAQPVAARPRPFAPLSPRSTLFHLRGHTFSAADAREGGASGAVADAYDLPARWRGSAPDDVIADIVREVLAADGVHMDTFDGADAHAAWARVKRTARYRFEGPLQNRPLHALTLSLVVLDRYGAAVHRYLRDALGYDGGLVWTAADIFQVYGSEFIPNSDEQAETLEGGMEAIAHGLRARAEKGGAEVFTRMRLMSFARATDTEFRYALQFTNSQTGEASTVLANNIILALPRLALEPLTSSFAALVGASAASAVAADVRAVGLGPAVKVAMWFDSPWWAAKHGTTAMVTTDLPLRQSYLFGDSAGGRSVVIATYCEMESVHFWRSLQEAGRETPKPLEGGLEDASPLVVAELLRQLREIFGEPAAEATPVRSVYKVWDGERDRDGTACHFWRPGSRGWEVAARMRQPMEGERVFVCGEAYSDRHGWVEGSLCTTEHVLRNQFGLAAPDWFEDGDDGVEAYNLGW